MSREAVADKDAAAPTLARAGVSSSCAAANTAWKACEAAHGSEFATLMDWGANGVATSVLEQMRSELSGKDAELERRQKELVQLKSELSTMDKELKSL